MKKIQPKKLILIFSIVFILIYIYIYILEDNSKSPIEITVIMRSVGEASEQKARENLVNIFGEDNVHLIKNTTPLFKATKKAYSIAIKENSTWTLFVDADTIIEKQRVELFIEKAKEIIKEDDKAFLFQGLMFDKFPQEYKHAGVWLYKTDSIKNLKKYENYCSAKLKPDDCFVSKYVESGKHSYVVELPIGIHDFFQKQSDIVAKYFLRCSRNKDKTEIWMSNWDKLAKDDQDFYWAKKGVELYDNYSKTSNLFYNDSKWIKNLVKNSNLEFNDNIQINDSDIEMLLKKYLKPIPNTLDEIEYYRSRLEKRKLI